MIKSKTFGNKCLEGNYFLKILYLKIELIYGHGHNVINYNLISVAHSSRIVQSKDV